MQKEKLEAVLKTFDEATGRRVELVLSASATPRAGDKPGETQVRTSVDTVGGSDEADSMYQDGLLAAAAMLGAYSHLRDRARELFPALAAIAMIAPEKFQEVLGPTSDQTIEAFAMAFGIEPQEALGSLGKIMSFVDKMPKA